MLAITGLCALPSPKMSSTYVRTRRSPHDTPHSLVTIHRHGRVGSSVVILPDSTHTRVRWTTAVHTITELIFDLRSLSMRICGGVRCLASLSNRFPAGHPCSARRIHRATSSASPETTQRPCFEQWCGETGRTMFAWTARHGASSV